MNGKDGKTKKAERIAALGHTEAVRRKSNPHAVLDVLTETTAAICDLFPPGKIPDDKFYLSHVDVKNNEAIISSTLAGFDTDVATALENGREEISINDWSAKITIPPSAAAAKSIIKAFWEETTESTKITVPGARKTPADPPARCPPEHEKEFHSSLRHAFDAIAHEDLDRCYTLRVAPAVEYTITSSQKSRWALGYCLPSSRLVMAKTKGCSLDILESVLVPQNGGAFRSQSHTNLFTRISTLVWNPDIRTGLFGLSNDLKFAGDFNLGSFKAEEEKIWGTSAPAFIYLMPLTNWAFVEASEAPATTAIWYLTFTAEKPPDPEDLFARRLRASRIFEEIIYQRYCKSLARFVAEAIVKADTEPDRLNKLSQSVSKIFGVTSPIVFSAGADDAENTISRKFGGLKTTGQIPGFRRWGDQTDHLLAKIGFEPVSGINTRPTAETDFLLRLSSSLETASGRGHGGSAGAVRSDLEQKIRELQELQAKTSTQISGLSRAIGIGRVEWPRLYSLKEVLHGTHTDCSCKHQNKGIRLGSQTLRQGHNICDSSECKTNADNMLVYLTEFHTDIAHRERIKSQFGDARSWWEEVKRGAQSEYKTLRAGAITTLLKLHGMAVTGSLGHDIELQNPPDDWDLSLAGICLLARDKQTPDTKPSVDLSVSDGKLTFVLKTMCYGWFSSGVINKYHEKTAGSFESDRGYHLAATYAIGINDIFTYTKSNSEWEIGNITLKVNDNNYLEVIWSGMTIS